MSNFLKPIKIKLKNLNEAKKFTIIKFFNEGLGCKYILEIESVYDCRLFIIYYLEPQYGSKAIFSDTIEEAEDIFNKGYKELSEYKGSKK